MINEVFAGLILSILLGALIGAQREIRQQKEHLKDFAGFRTFTFMSILGYIIGIIAFLELKENSILIVSIFGMFLLAISSYISLSKKSRNYVSITSQIIAIITFFIGILVSLKQYYFAITLAIIITTILFLGTKLHKFAKSIKKTEIFATLNFAIISFIILPLLPNRDFGPLDIPHFNELFLLFADKELLLQFQIFNPFHIWLMVVFISGITYIGYILMKTIGTERGITLTGFLGGLMSSTALTSSFSIESKKFPYLSNPLLVGTIIACSTMFFRIIFEVAIINPKLLPGVIGMTIMGIIGIAIAIYFYNSKKITHESKGIDIKSPFTLKPALKFAAFFIFILFLSELFTILFGDKGIYFVAFFSGFIDVDVITITLSRMAYEQTISDTAAQIGIFIAAVANTLFKGGIAYFLGSKEFSRRIIISFSIIIASGFGTLIFIL